MSAVWRAPAVLVGALVLTEVTGLVAGSHQLIPAPVLVANLVAGAPAALLAIGLVLVYRATKIINFAQGSLAGAAGIVFLSLQADGWPYLACIGAALGGAAVAGLVIEILVMRRFATSPRLVPTVASIAAGQLVLASSLILPSYLFGSDPTSSHSSAGEVSPIPSVPAHSPLSRHQRKWGVEVLTGDHVLAVAVSIVVVLALAWFFRRSRAGIGIRAAAENAEKAGTIGINTGALSSLVWLFAAALAGLSALLSQPLQGTTLANVGIGLGTGTLLQGLTAGVVAKMDDLPTAAAAAVGLSVFTGGVYFTTTSGADVELITFAVLAVALLLQRNVIGRVGSALTVGWAAAEEIRAVPRVLAAQPSVQAGRRWVLAVGAFVVLGYPFAMSPTQVFLGATIAIYGMVAVSLVVLTGWGGQISLGQFALVAVGAALGGGLIAHGWPFLVALPIAVAAGALVAMLLGLPALRVRGLFLAVVTLAFAAVVDDVVLDPNRFGFLNPALVPRPSWFASDRAFYYLSLAGLAAALFVALGLRRTRTGRVLIAMRDNEPAAQAMGLSLVRVRLTAFAVSGALASFAGVLYAMHEKSVRANGFTPGQSIQIFLMAVIGGLGSVTGVLTGAVYLGCVQLFVHSPTWQAGFSGVGVLAILAFFPAGLGGAAYAARDAFLRRVALREKIFVPSLLGDLSAVSGEDRRAPLGAKVGPVLAGPSYVLSDSDIAEAGSSQRGKGWVYA
jgi:branched-chain amino acid transport system permease protein